MPQQPITLKQQEILFHLYTYRYLNRHHIQILLKHKDSARINKWLTDLSNKHYINQIYSTQYGENTKPAIYYLANKSISILKNNPNVTPERLVKVYRERGRSNRFISHCLLVSEMYVKFLAEAKANGSELFFYANTELLDHEYLLKPVPDAYIALEHKNQTQRYFLDIFDENTPRYILRKRVEQYINYYEEGDWQENTEHPFPKILFLCPNKGLFNSIKRFIAKTREEKETSVSFALGLESEIKLNGLQKNTWQQIV